MSNLAGLLRLERRTTVLETAVLPIETMGPVQGKELYLLNFCLLVYCMLLTSRAILLFLHLFFVIFSFV